MPDPAFYVRNAFAHHCNDMIGYAEAWCRAADIEPEEKAEAGRRKDGGGWGMCCGWR